MLPPAEEGAWRREVFERRKLERARVPAGQVWRAYTSLSWLASEIPGFGLRCSDLLDYRLACVQDIATNARVPGGAVWPTVSEVLGRPDLV